MSQVPANAHQWTEKRNVLLRGGPADGSEVWVEDVGRNIVIENSDWAAEYMPTQERVVRAGRELTIFVISDTA